MVSVPGRLVGATKRIETGNDGELQVLRQQLRLQLKTKFNNLVHVFR